MLYVTALLAIVLIGLYQALSVRIIRLRGSEKVLIGDGGVKAIARLMRAQSNLFEYGAIFLALLALAESADVSRILLGVLALVFLFGRVLHLYGLLVTEPDEARGAARVAWRVRGMAITLILIPVMAVIVLATLVLGLFG